jgi:hypothetical protein
MANFLGDLLRFCVVYVRNNDSRVLCGKEPRNRLANSGGGPGHNGDFPVQFSQVMSSAPKITPTIRGRQMQLSDDSIVTDNQKYVLVYAFCDTLGLDLM